MAEGDGAQNQGKQGQSGPLDPSTEVKSEVVDQAKLDRAAKERERRRRRRRKKAELKRLERETLQQAGDLPQSVVSKPEKPEGAVVEKQAEKVVPERKKEALPPVEHPIAKRSEEHAPRSKVIVPQAQQKEEKPQKLVREPVRKPLEKTVQKPEEPVKELPPLSHKTHSFAGPLIHSDEVPVQKSEPPKVEAKELGTTPEEKPEPRPEPVVTPEVPESKPEPKPEPAVQPEVYPDVQQIAAPPEPEPEPEDVSLENLPPIFPTGESEEESDVIIKDPHQESRPPVSMEEVHTEKEKENELPPIFPYPQPPEEKKVLEEESEAEEIKPLKKVKKVEEKEHKAEKKESSKETMSESEGLNVRKSFLQAAGGFSAGVLKSVGTALHNFRLKFDVKKLGLFLVLMVIGGGLYAGYLLKVHEKVYNYVADFFKAPPPVEVHLDDQLLREWGITTALLFGDNR